MSLNEILLPNVYNIYSNSLTMNTNSVQPVAGSNTLWINSLNGHVYRDGVDLEDNGPPLVTESQLFMPITQWDLNFATYLPVFDATNLLRYVQAFTGGAGSTEAYCFYPIMGSPPQNIILTSFEIVYIVNAGADSADVALSLITYADNAAVTITPVPITGSMELVPDADMRVSTFTITTPLILAQNQALIASLILTSVGPPLDYSLYGSFSNFSVPI